MLKNVFSSFFILCLSVLTIQKGYSKEKQPNFIIIFTDDMGYGDLGCFGNKLNSTPNIDRLAEEGIRLPTFMPGPLFVRLQEPHY